MAITGSYPSDFQDQQDYLLQVNDTFKALEAQTSLVSVHSASEPSQAVLKAQWAAQVPFASPTNGGQVLWFNPITQKIEQVYYPVIGGSSDLYPYKEKPSSVGMVCLGEAVVGASATLFLGSIPATYKHLYVQWSARSSGAGATTDTVAMRLNANAGATHAWLGYSLASGANPGIITNTAQTQAQVGFSPNNGMTNQAQASVGSIWIPNYAMSLTGLGLRLALSTCVGFSTNTRPYTKTYQRIVSVYPATGAITSIALFAATATNFIRGSKMVVWAM